MEEKEIMVVNSSNSKLRYWMQKLANIIVGKGVTVYLTNTTTAYTNGLDVFIGVDGSAVKSETSEKGKFFLSIGLLIHELGHIMYTPFPKRGSNVSYANVTMYLNNNGTFPKEVFPTEKFDEKFFKDFSMYLAKLYKDFSNSICDGHIEQRLLRNLPSWRKEIMYMRNRWYSDQQSYTDLKDQHKNIILMSFALSYSLNHDIKSAGADDELIRAFEELKPYIDKALVENNGVERIKAVNNAFVKAISLMDFTKPNSNDSNKSEQKSDEQQSGGDSSDNSQNSQDSQSSQNDSSENNSDDSNSNESNESNSNEESSNGENSEESSESTGNNSNEESSDSDNSEESNSNREGSNEENTDESNGEGTGSDESKDESKDGSEENESSSNSSGDEANSDLDGNDEGKGSEAKDNSNESNDAKDENAGEKGQNGETGNTTENTNDGNSNETSTGEGSDGESSQSSMPEMLSNEEIKDMLEQMSQQISGDSQDEMSNVNNMTAINQEMNPNPNPNPNELNSSMVFEQIHSDDVVFSEASFSGSEDSRAKVVATELATKLTASLRRKLKDEKETVARGLYVGKKLDTKKLYRADKRIMTKKKYPDRPSMRVVTLMDISGSMNHEDRIYEARKIALSIKKACERLSIDTETYAFNGAITPLITDKDILTVCPQGGTNDYIAFKFALDRMKKGKNFDRRMIIVCTDGCGTGHDKLNPLLKACKQQKIGVIACGVGSERERVEHSWSDLNYGAEVLECSSEAIASELVKAITKAYRR